jgi:hypothetical protein
MIQLNESDAKKRGVCYLLWQSQYVDPGTYIEFYDTGKKNIERNPSQIIALCPSGTLSATGRSTTGRRTSHTSTGEEVGNT